MNEYETTMEFLGEDRSLLVMWESEYGNAYIHRVEIVLLEHKNYTSTGEYYPHVERRILDIASVLSVAQMHELSDEILADCKEKAAEDYNESRMIGIEELSRRAYVPS